MPKVEYQPEFGFEKLCEEQLIEYWLDTYFRNPKTKITLCKKCIKIVLNFNAIENYHLLKLLYFCLCLINSF
jgi:hypothetical protein